MLKVSGHHLWACFAEEGHGAGEREIVDATDRIHVGADIDLLTLELFGRHKEDRAVDSIAFSDFLKDRLGGELGQTEVDDLDLELSRGKPVEHQVRRFQIPVYKIEVLRRDQAFLDLHGKLAEVHPRKRGGFLDDLVDGFTLQQLHDDEGAFLIGADIIDGDDVRMLEGGKSSGLLSHLLGGLLVVRLVVAGRDPLDRDFPLQSQIVGTVNGSQASLTEFSSDFVAVLHS